MEIFHRHASVPVHSVRNANQHAEALGYPRGEIALGICGECGFISNTAFDSTKIHYGAGYESTQACSPTFNAFARSLARELVDTYGLNNKTILEIGCGNGEFLDNICSIGGNRGIGFDPAYAPEHSPCEGKRNIRIIRDTYSDQYTDIQADFIMCRMTLEHIPDVGAFMSNVRRVIGSSPTPVLIQVPDVTRILSVCAFEDVYYEHCSYFSAGSLGRLFRHCGFKPLDYATPYSGQYVVMTAEPVQRQEKSPVPIPNDLDYLAHEAARYAQRFEVRVRSWLRLLERLERRGYRAVVWGAGSKAVSFLSALGNPVSVEYAVDINPRRQGTYLVGTGQKIVAPDFLREYRPDVVVVMNRIYSSEIRSRLSRIGLNPLVYEL